jgi:hypothetical protein
VHDPAVMDPFLKGTTTNSTRANRPDALLATWVISCALVTLSGWALSIIDQLNRSSYCVIITIVVLVAYEVLKRSLVGLRWTVRTRRFRYVLVWGFLSVAVAALIAGVMHAPTNYDGVTYRIPRLLHWTAAGHWTWIVTPNPRMNFSATGFEWLSAPFLILLRTDRFLFLLNFISFLFMPGLVFSVFRQLGVPQRSAWTWMWVLPCAYC